MKARPLADAEAARMRAIRMVLDMKERRRLQPTHTEHRDLRGWSFGLSLGLGVPGIGAEDLWMLSARLSPPGRGSQLDDWRFLGEVVAAVGAPDEPLTPIDEGDPNRTFYWAWRDGDPERASVRFLDAPGGAVDLVELIEHAAQATRRAVRR